MSEKELISEVRRGLITIMRAVIKYAIAHGIQLSWTDFLPREENQIIAEMAKNRSITPPPVYEVAGD